MSTNLEAVLRDQFAIFSMGVAIGSFFYIAIIYICPPKKSSGEGKAKEKSRWKKRVTVIEKSWEVSCTG